MPKSIILFILFSISISAQADSTRVYTQEHPLVYEDAYDLWPYSFLNEKGLPDGYNIDLIGLLMDKLNIPYIIKLKPQQEAFQDLKSGVSDLTLGLAAGFHDEYGRYGRNAITLFTQSVATPKSSPVAIKTFRDLSKPDVKVIVNDSSLCYHLMLDYDWDEHIIVSNDIKEAIQQVNDKEEGQIVWNTLSLKWLIQHYHLNNLQLTPVNMPHGDYKFMSNDQQLLDLLDKAYSDLYLDDKITPLQDKWFYPEREEPTTPDWEWYFTWLAVVFLAIAIIYTVIYMLQNRRVSAANTKLNRRLALIMETSKVRIWTYDVKEHTFAWHNDNGQIACTYTKEEFAQRYSDDDFDRLKEALDRLISQHKDARGHEEEEIKLELKAKDVEGGDNELHDFIVVVSVLERDKSGKPSLIIGTKKDVTEQHRIKQREDERTLRYWSIFYSQDTAIFYFNKDGYIQDANLKACEICHCNSDDLIKEHVHINDFFHTKLSDFRHTSGYHAIRKFEETRVECQMKPVFNDEDVLLGIFVFCRAL